ncbi:hypothetical protein PR048_012836 [Dryococelus australis]|uniref:Uncharacterized protein n=1 Tax=Dryococelus australis TaxID=614101 RepID=A0ABQ9HQI9_9NEOP|nr:hypothetical protein PR048_012836 [Dryococelus australis]
MASKPKKKSYNQVFLECYTKEFLCVTYMFKKWNVSYEGNSTKISSFFSSVQSDDYRVTRVE